MRKGSDMHLRSILTIVCIALASFLSTGCETIRSMTGQPTQAQVTAAEKAYADQEKALEAAKLDVAKMKADIDAAKAAQASIDAQKDTLSKLQAQVALQLASADDATRPFLEQQLDSVRQQMQAIVDKRKAAAAQVARFAASAAEVQAAVDSASEELARRGENLTAMQEQAKEAVTSIGAGIAALGNLVGQYVPGASVIGQQAGTAATTLLGLSTAAFGAATVRASKRRKEAEEEAEQAAAQRDAARRVIANTEKFGFDEITRDPAVRAKAKAALDADEAAKLELAQAKAGLFASLRPA